MAPALPHRPRTAALHAPDPAEQAELERIAGERIDEELEHAPQSTRRQVVRLVGGLTVVLLSFYIVGPSIVETLSSAPRLATITWWWFPIMAVLEAASFAAQWAVSWIAIRRAHWWEIATSQLSGNALGRIVPGGGAAAGALQYRMLVDSGTPRGAAATGLTATNILTFGVLLGLPFLAVPAILLGLPIDRTLRQALVWAGMVLLALVAGAVVLVVSEAPLRFVGDRFQRLRNRLRPNAAPLSGVADRIVSERDLMLRIVGERWKRALLASVLKWLLDLGVLVAALAALGSHPPLPLILLAYCFAQLLGQIPLTPGGLGFVEAGLTGLLALIGVNGGDAVLATLAWRLWSYWLPVPIGGAAYWVFRRRHPSGGAPPPVAEAV